MLNLSQSAEVLVKPPVTASQNSLAVVGKYLLLKGFNCGGPWKPVRVEYST